MTRYNAPYTLDQSTLDAIAIYMDDDIRETVHAELAPCTPDEFLTRYVELDPGFSDLLESEFSIDLYEPCSDNSLTDEADIPSAAERRAFHKQEKAMEYSGWRRYPSTCEAIFSNIPADWYDRYTAKQLGEIAALLKTVYDKGRNDAQ